MSVVAFGHQLKRNGQNELRLPSTPKGLEPRLAEVAGGLLGRDQRLARVELAWILGEGLAHRPRHRKTDVRVNIHFAHTAADAASDFLDRNPVGLFDIAAMFANDGE